MVFRPQIQILRYFKLKIAENVQIGDIYRTKLVSRKNIDFGQVMG